MMTATSIFFIVIIASKACFASSPPAASASVSARGVICQERPQPFLRFLLGHSWRRLWLRGGEVHPADYGADGCDVRVRPDAGDSLRRALRSVETNRGVR